MRPELLGSTARRVSAPLLPMNAAGADDERAHLLVRLIFEDIALAQLRGRSEVDRLRALSELDRLPVAQRVGIGRFLFEAMELVSNAPKGETMWHHRRLLSDESSPTPVQLAYGACSHPWDDFVRDTFGWWVQLRHHELGEALGSNDALTTIGVVLTPRYDGVRPWDTSMVSAAGDLQLDQETTEIYRKFWPRQD